MCGIAGWYGRGGTAVPAGTIRAQCDTIRHRGPDDEGILVDGDFGFGMRRLAIVDIAGGHQPIATPDGRHAIVFNGEIYNHPALRRELAASGHAFATHSDTETILAAFVEWGDAAWQRLDGMFAVAIWDRRERRLTLARDPLGVKPLYVTQQNGGLAFASELKALLPLPGHRFDVSPRAMHDLFSFGHIRTDRSIYRQVQTLAPGHVLSIAATGEARCHAFWRPAYRSDPARSEGDWIEAFRAQWLSTVEQHLLGDVEVGAFLSGGVDSSAVVAAMARLGGAPVKTFTIGFPIARYDESPHAEAVARHLGCDHTTRMIDLAQARDVLPLLQRCFDEPFADPSAVPTWYLSRLAREQVKVVLSGDGGDELFMGYKRHLTERRIGNLPRGVRHAARGVMALPGTPVRRWNRTVQRWQKAVGSAALPDGASRFFAKTRIMSDALRARVFDADFHAAFDGAGSIAGLCDEYFPDPAVISADGAEQFAYADLTLNLPCAMLTKVDRASMAHSLEVRVPLLGPSLVEWAMGVPADMKIRNGVGKHILREAIRPWVPEGIVDRRKQGFQIPLAEWFDGDFGRHAQEVWRDSGAADLGFLRGDAVDAVFAEHRAGKADHGRFLYALAMVGHWCEARARQPAAVPAPIAITPRAPAPAPATVQTVANDNPARWRHGRRVGVIAAMFVAGWFTHDAIGPLTAPARASDFIDDAVMSHRVTLARSTMRSQPEVMDYDRAEIAAVTGIAMPRIPAGWRVLDVQIYPTDAGQSVEVAVVSDRGEELSIFGMRADSTGGATPSIDRRHADRIAYWEQGALAFALVGRIGSARLLQLAARLDPVSAS